MKPQEYNELRNPRFYKFLDYKEMFSWWDWQWFATLTFPHFYNYRDSYALSKPVTKWAMNLGKTEGLRVGYLNLIGWKYGHPTIHLLMLGFGRGGAITLQDVDCNFWEEEWPYKAQIEIPRCNADVEGYIARHAFWKHAHKETLIIGGEKLLKKLKKPDLIDCAIIT